MKTAKASPEIWKKFTRMEKQLWRDVYAICLQPEMWPPISRAARVASGMTEPMKIFSHNVACQVVWLLQSHPITKKIKIENGDLIRFKNGSTIKFGSLKKTNRKIRSGDMYFQDDLTGRGLCSKKRPLQKA